MFNKLTIRPLLLAALLSTAATAAAAPTTPRGADAPADEGALTLEASPAARFFRLFGAADDAPRRDALGRLLPGRVQDPYDHTLSDSFTRHDPVRAAAAPTRPRPFFTTAEKPAPRPAADAAPATAWDLSPAVVAPASASSAHDALALTPASTGPAAVWRASSPDGANLDGPVSAPATKALTAPAVGAFASPGPNVTLRNAVALVRADSTNSPVAARLFPDADPLPASQIGLSALTTTDQQSTANNSFAVAFTNAGVGQSFTPTQSTINAATFSLYLASGNTTSSTVQLQVYSGPGFTGTLLATGTPVTFTNTTAQIIELTLPTPLVLTPGQTYTLRALTTAGNYAYNYSTTDAYAGGTRFFANGNGAGAGDVVFAEGFDAAVGVPEPATWAAGALTFAAAGCALRRRLRPRPVSC